jgi:hypothetical protein
VGTASAVSVKPCSWKTRLQFQRWNHSTALAA